jgi:hypothetical protein
MDMKKLLKAGAKEMPAMSDGKKQAMKDVLMDLKKFAQEMMMEDLGKKGIIEIEVKAEPVEEMEEAEEKEGMEEEMPEEMMAEDEESGDDMEKMRELLKAKKKMA